MISFYLFIYLDRTDKLGDGKVGKLYCVYKVSNICYRGRRFIRISFTEYVFIINVEPPRPPGVLLSLFFES